jgi:hypothetical protein
VTARFTPAGLCVVCLSCWLGSPAVARATPAPADPPAPSGAFFLQVAAGPAYTRESWKAGAESAVSSGWGPSLEVTLGRRAISGWAVAGNLRVAGFFNRDETFRGKTYELSQTLHLVDVLSASIDYRSRVRWHAHFGGSLGLAAVSEIDTYDGQTETRWGLAAGLHAGIDPIRRGRWWLGLVACLTYYHYDASSVPPATFNGLLPGLLLTFARE